MKAFFLTGLLCLAGPAVAQQVYKCPGRDGVPVYQSAPCSGGVVASRKWNAADTYQRPARPTAARVIRQPSISAGHSYEVAGVSESRAKDMRCAAAKRHRDDTLKRVGLARNFDLLRQLDDQVYEACKR